MRNTYLQLCDFGSRFRILKGGKISLVVSVFIASTTLLYAAPSGGVVTSGSASIAQSGNVTNITQSTQKAAINWNNFSIGTSEVVNFNQPNVNAVTLNRVVGNEKSIIDGVLNANGQVLILNSNGVLFSKNASINTAGLVATTMSLSDADFMSGNYSFKGDSTASVINQGTINISDKGYAALFGKEVKNEGIIKATFGKIELVGAKEVTLNLNGNSLVNLKVDKGVLDALVENKGAIYADGGEVYLTINAVNELLKGVVNNTGIVEAKTLDDVSGKIILFAHGGETYVGGKLDASAPNGGDGGFIETSGKNFRLLDKYFVTTASKQGKTGTWLIDPSDIYIQDGGAEGVGGSVMDADDVIAALATNNLTLTADSNIYIQEALTITQNTLTLSAGESLSPEAPVTVSGTAGLIVKVKQSSTVAQIIANGDDDITAGNFIYNLDDNDIIAKSLTVAPTASYTYQVGSDGTPMSLTGVFNNGKIRIGNGWYNSIGSNGMLEQPWYYDDVTPGRNDWYKLTYNNYHLDQVVAIGGDGTNIWNLNGDIIHTDHDTSDYFRLMDKVTNVSVDTSGFSNGTGTITSTVTFVSDNFGQFKLINSYVLDAGVNFIKTTTSVKNESGSDATNVRIWVGTRDDYIAVNDSNYKTKGNIGANGFEPITVQTDEAKAIIITEDTFASGNGAAVLFYSTTANTNTIIEDCCSISNVIDLNPIDSIMNLDNDGAEDGSYGIFLSLGSLANQQTKNLVWYYAAGPVSQLNDVVAQVGQNSGASTPSQPAQDLTPIITQIVNNTAVQSPVMRNFIPSALTLRTLQQQFSFGGQSVQLMSTPPDDVPTDIITMADIRQMQPSGETPSAQSSTGSGIGSTDVRVPLGRNSLIQLLNGGVRLPENVEQEFFMARN